MEFEPTAEHRKTVRALSGFGVPQDDIAAYLDIDPKTLRKHFRVELDRGSLEATAKVAQSLFNMATSGNNVAAAIFLDEGPGWLAGEEQSGNHRQGRYPAWTDRHHRHVCQARRFRRRLRPSSAASVRGSPLNALFNTDQRPLIGGEPD
jgi:hypothetical protein